jgi:hypothetical protein
MCAAVAATVSCNIGPSTDGASGSASTSASLVLEVAGGNAIAAWLERGAGQWAVHTARYTPTEGWGPSERIDQATYVVQTPDLAVSASGKAAAVWAQRSDGSSGQRIWANQYE